MKRTILSLAIISLPMFAYKSLGVMGELELSYSSEDEIPENAREYYTEEGGVWILTGVKGGGKKNIERLEASLRKERNDHKQTKTTFSRVQGLDIDELLRRNDEYEELKLRAEGNLDDKKVDELVETRIKARLTPLQRELQQTKEMLTGVTTERDELIGKEKSARIKSALRKAARTAKVVDSAIEDVEQLGASLFELDDNGNIIAREGTGLTPGIDPAMWLSDVKDKKPHWFPGSYGGGAKGGKGGMGSDGDNPWSADGWNLTAQGRILKENPERAKRMASMHGVDLKNPKRPAKK